MRTPPWTKVWLSHSAGSANSLRTRSTARPAVAPFPPRRPPLLDRLAPPPSVPPAGGRGRLIFARDATASREPTWDRACHLQGEMFKATEGLGGLEAQLVFYRGFGECKASPGVDNAEALVRRMTAVQCLGGQTQIARVMRHAMAETRRRRVNALVFVGDCMEEDVDRLCHEAGELALLGVPMFVFPEGAAPAAERAFRPFAKPTGGAYCRFDRAAANQPRGLACAAAASATPSSAPSAAAPSGGGAPRGHGRRSIGAQRIIDQMFSFRAGADIQPPLVERSSRKRSSPSSASVTPWAPASATWSGSGPTRSAGSIMAAGGGP